MMDSEGRTCAARLRRYMGQCDRSGTVEVGGKWYCWQHDPNRLHAESAKRWEKRKAEIAREDAAFEAKLTRKRLLESAGLLDVPDNVAAAVRDAGGLAELLDRHRWRHAIIFGRDAFEAVLGGIKQVDDSVALDLRPFAAISGHWGEHLGRRVLVVPVPDPPAREVGP